VTRWADEMMVRGGIIAACAFALVKTMGSISTKSAFINDLSCGYIVSLEYPEVKMQLFNNFLLFPCDIGDGDFAEEGNMKTFPYVECSGRRP